MEPPTGLQLCRKCLELRKGRILETTLFCLFIWQISEQLIFSWLHTRCAGSDGERDHTASFLSSSQELSVEWETCRAWGKLLSRGWVDKTYWHLRTWVVAGFGRGTGSWRPAGERPKDRSVLKNVTKHLNPLRNLVLIWSLSGRQVFIKRFLECSVAVTMAGNLVKLALVGRMATRLEAGVHTEFLLQLVEVGLGLWLWGGKNWMGLKVNEQDLMPNPPV